MVYQTPLVALIIDKHLNIIFLKWMSKMNRGTLASKQNIRKPWESNVDNARINEEKCDLNFLVRGTFLRYFRYVNNEYELGNMKHMLQYE